MHPKDHPRFFKSLVAMGDFFCDELSEARQAIYFAVFHRVAIEAWEYACLEAIRTETFHKVPLPAVLLEHVAMYTKQQTQAALALMPPDADERLRAADRARASAELDALIATSSPDEQARINAFIKERYYGQA